MTWVGAGETRLDSIRSENPLIGPAGALAVERGRADTEHPRRLRQRAAAGTDGCLDNKALDLGQGHPNEGVGRCRKFVPGPASAASIRRLGARVSRRFRESGHAAGASDGVDHIAAVGARRRGGIHTHLSVDLFLNVFEHPINLAKQPWHIARDLRGIVPMARGVHPPGPLLHRQGANSAGNRDQDMGH